MQATAVTNMMRQALSMTRMGCTSTRARAARMPGPGLSPAYSTLTGTVEVCFVDPKVALSHGSPAGASSRSVQQLVVQGHALVVPLPAALTPHLTKGVLELGDADDPLNAWCWGERGEIFQYTMAGTHSTKSGFTAVIPRSDLEALLQGGQQQQQARGPPSWQAFMGAVSDDGDGSGREDGGCGSVAIRPFLFTGRILESDLASVYVLKRGGDVMGVMVSSEAAGSS